jgi:glycosyltransferase involved in cell wall biosynthesis
MPHLPETMRSILHQSFRDFKILVINDGSKDDSLEYLKTLRDPRLKIISQENSGLTTTLNRMLREIDTPWLVRHDADDIAFHDRMGELNALAAQHPDAGLLYSRARHYQDGRLLLELLTTVDSPAGLRRLTRDGHLLSICHSTVALNVRKLLDIGGYRFDLYVEDYDMYWRMALATDLQFIDRVLVGARVGSRGISGSNISRQNINMLWIQYLLISNNLGLQPGAYEQIVPKLEKLLPQGMTQYRLNMRRTLDRIGEERYLSALRYIVKAAAASPEAFFCRIGRLIPQRQKIVLGSDPGQFLRRRALLWPPPKSGSQANCNRASSTRAH